jgi:hypothetical protein
LTCSFDVEVAGRVRASSLASTFTSTTFEGPAIFEGEASLRGLDQSIFDHCSSSLS